MIKKTLLFLLISISPVHAGIVDDIKASIRPHLVKIIGLEKTNQLLGNDSSQISMPSIPKVVKDAKSISNYGQGPKNEVAYKKDQERRFNYNFVKELFQATRKVEANDGDIAKWMNVLEQNGSREGVYRALVLDGTYLSLENYEFPMEKRTVDFTTGFIERFLDKSINGDVLMKANFYTVKRDITEKTLEVMDELFKREGDDIYDWYALLSADMAKQFPKAMNNKTRKESDPQKHKLWAKSVPDQYLKSEVIIKLHNVFNLIQG